jgi:hypothetical protein
VVRHRIEQWLFGRIQPRRCSPRADLRQVLVGELASAVEQRLMPCPAAVVYVLSIMIRFLHMFLGLVAVEGQTKRVAAQPLPQRHDFTHEVCCQIGVDGITSDRCVCAADIS